MNFRRIKREWEMTFHSVKACACGSLNPVQKRQF